MLAIVARTMKALDRKLGRRVSLGKQTADNVTAAPPAIEDLTDAVSYWDPELDLLWLNASDTVSWSERQIARAFYRI